MPEAHYGLPNKVFKDEDQGLYYVRYDKVSYTLNSLMRQDLIRVSATIAASKGRKSGGIKWSNIQHRDYIRRNTPWEANVPSPLPDKAPDLKLPDHLKFDPEVARTKVKCDCGHEYQYRIKPHRFDATKRWLESKPCPPCQRKGVEPKGGQPGFMDPNEAPNPDVLPDDNGDLRLDYEATWKMPPLHHEALPEVIKALEAGVPVWLEGPPGTSKSTIGQQAAEVLDLPFHVISCHEAMTRSDMFGYTDAKGTDHRSPLWDAYENGGVLLLDEIDNGNANILAALNSALSNGYCTFAGRTIPKHDDFRVLSAANTAGLGPEAGFIGRMGVDMATLDRFVTIKIPIDEKLETAIVKGLLPDHHKQLLKVVRKLRKLVENRGLRAVVSPRTAISSARMLKAGVPLSECLKRTALKGMDRSTVDSLLNELGIGV